MDRIIFCLFMPKDIEIYLRLLPVYFPPAQNERAEESDDTKGATSHSSMAVESGETISASTQSQKNEQGKTQVKALQAKDTGNALPLKTTQNDAPREEAPAQVKLVEDSLLKDMKPEKKKNP